MSFLFGNKSKYRRLADDIGKHVHRQLIVVLNNKPTTFGTPDELAFTAGYLRALTWRVFREEGCVDNVIHMEYIKHFCNGVLPGRLWEVVNKGSELNDLANGLAGAASLQVRKAYKLGEDAAFYDGHKMLDLHTNPNGLELFLLGLPLEFIGQPEWNS